MFFTAMKTKSRRKCPKAQYKVKNWSAYNQGLVERGFVTVWFPVDCDEFWHDRREPGRGAQFVYSDRAIEVLLLVRQVFGLAYRQTEGFATSLMMLMGLDLEIPCYSQICRRARGLSVDLGRISEGARIHVAADSTGLKVYGEGEWKVRQHGYSKRRTWRKMHVCTDPDTTEALAVVLTGNEVHGSEVVGDMLGQVPETLETFGADGAYDTMKVHEQLAGAGIHPAIPPRRGSVIARHGNSKAPPLPRDEAIRGIRKHGGRGWKMRSGYHRRSKAETFMYRCKRAFGAGLKSRGLERQGVEVAIGCKALNMMLKLARPISEKVS